MAAKCIFDFDYDLTVALSSSLTCGKAVEGRRRCGLYDSAGSVSKSRFCGVFGIPA